MLKCDGTWQEVKAEAQQLAQGQAPVATTLAGLRQAARLKACVALIDTDELAKLREENAHIKAAREECRRLKMELADMRGEREAETLEFEAQRDELYWCKNELYRLNPRLAATRWGKR